jgi:hypothetical protein
MFDIRGFVGRTFARGEAMVNGALAEVVQSGAVTMIHDALGSPNFADLRGELATIGETLAGKILSGMSATEVAAATDLLRVAKAVTAALSQVEGHSAALAGLSSSIATMAARLSALEAAKAPPMAAVAPAINTASAPSVAGLNATGADVTGAQPAVAQ